MPGLQIWHLLYWGNHLSGAAKTWCSNLYYWVSASNTKTSPKYALFDVLDFWKFQLRISPPAITIYLLQPKLGAAMYINESFQQHKYMSQNLLFDILEFWKFWPRIPSLITTTYGMPFKLGAVVCDNRYLPTAQT